MFLGERQAEAYLPRGRLGMMSIHATASSSFQGDRYETPIDLRGKQIVVRYERHRKGAIIVYDNGRRLGQARLLNAVANGLARRKETP